MKIVTDKSYKKHINSYRDDFVKQLKKKLLDESYSIEQSTIRNKSIVLGRFVDPYFYSLMIVKEDLESVSVYSHIGLVKILPSFGSYGSLGQSIVLNDEMIADLQPNHRPLEFHISVMEREDFHIDDIMEKINLNLVNLKKSADVFLSSQSVVKFYKYLEKMCVIFISNHQYQSLSLLEILEDVKLSYPPVVKYEFLNEIKDVETVFDGLSFPEMFTKKFENSINSSKHLKNAFIIFARYFLRSKTQDPDLIKILDLEGDNRGAADIRNLIFSSFMTFIEKTYEK